MLDKIVYKNHNAVPVVWLSLHCRILEHKVRLNNVYKTLFLSHSKYIMSPRQRPADECSLGKKPNHCAFL